MQFIKGGKYHSWISKKDEKFLKPYYYFLRFCINPYYKYTIYVDDSPWVRKNSRWQNLEYSVRNRLKNDWNLNSLKQLSPINSATSNLIQLTDILLGCFLYELDNLSKKTVIEFLEKSFKPKFYILPKFEPLKNQNKRKDFDIIHNAFKPYCFVDAKNQLHSQLV